MTCCSPVYPGQLVLNRIQAATQAIEALIALGYKSADAAKMVKSVAADGAATEQIIRLALRSTQRQKLPE